MAQLPLPLSFDKRFSLSNYFAENSSYIKQHLMALFDETGESLIGLCGASDSGKTHLLNACAHYARDCKIQFHLYDALQLQQADAQNFADLPAGSVIGVDNLDLLAGNRLWEAQLYQLVNRVKASELRLIFTLSRMPRDTGFRLPDLKSRLMWGLLISLKVADDRQVEVILKERAKLLGLVMSDEVAAYLLSHFSRKLSDQIELLYRLDRISLTSQRRITIPLIRQNLL